MSPHQPTLAADTPTILSVAALSAKIKDRLESSFPQVWVAGEISNLSRPASGHCYLTLKDDQAQLRAVIWASVANKCRFELEDGLEVVCFGDLEVYAPRGNYQLIVRRIEPRGIGALELALRRLREKLAAEGLFDPEHKQPLPAFPKRIALITSPTGAVVHDFLQVARRRWRGAQIFVVPTPVQGDGAAPKIARAIGLVQTLREPPDVIVVARGGGSLEDLWAFNEEVVVRAIFRSQIPVVSAIGHEVDVTLADLVADRRALTPSEAAELVVPAAEDLLAYLAAARQRLGLALRGRAQRARARLDELAARRVLRRPFDLVHQYAQRVDDAQTRATRAVRQHAQSARQRLVGIAAQLEALSPLAVLSRGYSLTERLADGALVRSARDVTGGELIRTRLADGALTSRVVRDVDPSD